MEVWHRRQDFVIDVEEDILGNALFLAFFDEFLISRTEIQRVHLFADFWKLLLDVLLVWEHRILVVDAIHVIEIVVDTVEKRFRQMRHGRGIENNFRTLCVPCRIMLQLDGLHVILCDSVCHIGIVGRHIDWHDEDSFLILIHVTTKRVADFIEFGICFYCASSWNLTAGSLDFLVILQYFRIAEVFLPEL